MCRAKKYFTFGMRKQPANQQPASKFVTLPTTKKRTIKETKKMQNNNNKLRHPFLSFPFSLCFSFFRLRNYHFFPHFFVNLPCLVYRVINLRPQGEERTTTTT
jgi:hypothetical protein